MRMHSSFTLKEYLRNDDGHNWTFHLKGTLMILHLSNSEIMFLTERKYRSLDFAGAHSKSSYDMDWIIELYSSITQNRFRSIGVYNYLQSCFTGEPGQRERCGRKVLLCNYSCWSFAPWSKSRFNYQNTTFYCKEDDVVTLYTISIPCSDSMIARLHFYLKARKARKSVKVINSYHKWAPCIV